MLVLSLVLLCASSSLSAPARVLKQRVQKFKNFPVVGIKETPAETETASYTQAEPLAIVDHPRDARQADTENYEEDNGDGDLFIEEAVYLTPEAREARAAVLGDLSEPQDVAVGANRPGQEVRTVFGDDIFFHDETQQDEEEEEYTRQERDGAHGHHRGGHRGSSQRAGRVVSPPAPVVNEYDNYDYDYQEQEEEVPQRSQPQQQRRGKQTGATGVALGVLSSPSDQDGNYNFNFANDDGSSRQEVGAPDAIRGSYSFVTPEGEQVSVQYHADETGFHATGSHVPQAPPMPAHVQRLLDHLAKVNGLERL